MVEKQKEVKKEERKEESSFAPRSGASEDNGELKQQLDECRKLKEEYLEGWKRERAGFLNYKKEEMERIGELIKYANEELILKILPILDNFDVAEKKIPETLKQDENFKGILQIKTQILDFLKSQGVEEIKAIGEKFNPNFHEAVGEAEPSFAKASEGEGKEHGIVIEEVKKGYTLYGKLIRPAKVKISK